MQQTFEPGAKSTEELTSTSYFVAPGTGGPRELRVEHLGARRRGRSRSGVVIDGHEQLNDETGDARPRLPSESTGTTFQ